jgi:hypothetical protein
MICSGFRDIRTISNRPTITTTTDNARAAGCLQHAAYGNSYFVALTDLACPQG